jgi:hypothetical protein
MLFKPRHFFKFQKSEGCLLVGEHLCIAISGLNATPLCVVLALFKNLPTPPKKKKRIPQFKFNDANLLRNHPTFFFFFT